MNEFGLVFTPFPLCHPVVWQVSRGKAIWCAQAPTLLSRVIKAIDKSGKFREQVVFCAGPKIQPFDGIWT